jgi:predicted nucleotidyltransferase
MKIRPDIDVDGEALAAFCRRHGIRRLALFGSALGDDFGPDSDLDLLVEFDRGSVPGLVKLAAMELELAHLFGGREVELRTPADLSPHFREDVQSRAVPLYAAA